MRKRQAFTVADKRDRGNQDVLVVDRKLSREVAGPAVVPPNNGSGPKGCFPCGDGLISGSNVYDTYGTVIAINVSHSNNLATESWTWDEPEGNPTLRNPAPWSTGGVQACWGGGQSTGFGGSGPEAGAAGTTYRTGLNHDGGSVGVAAVEGAVLSVQGYAWRYNSDFRIEYLWSATGGSAISIGTLVYNSAWADDWTFWSATAGPAPAGTAGVWMRCLTGASGGLPATLYMDQVLIQIQSPSLPTTGTTSNPVGFQGGGTQIGTELTRISSTVYQLPTVAESIIGVWVDGLLASAWHWEAPDQIVFANELIIGSQVYVRYAAAPSLA